MKRFVTYLYEYKEGQKIKNTGHIRVDVRNQFLNMQISIKNLDLKNEIGTFYLIIKNERIYVVPLKEISMQNGLYNGRMTCNCYEANISLQQVVGIGIQYKNGYYMASCWKDGEEHVIAQKEFFNFEEQDVHEEESKIEESKIEEEEAKVHEEMIAASILEENPKEIVMLPTYRKVNLNEIYALPSRYWHFSNNSFLIHGFWNYGYLVLKESLEENEKRMSLGVPGIFEEPEMVMAGYFGFPEFEALPSQMVEMEIGQSCKVSVEEKNQHPQAGTFGCWFVNL